MIRRSSAPVLPVFVCLVVSACGDDGAPSNTGSGSGSSEGTTHGVVSMSEGPTTSGGSSAGSVDGSETAAVDGSTTSSGSGSEGSTASSGPASTGAVGECGNGALEDDEACDGARLGGETCEAQGFDHGTLACDARCLLDTTGCGTCGNVIVDGDEVCDGIVLFGETCESQGFDSGQLACQADCLGYDASGCGLCGNSLVDGAEVCDDGNMIDGDACANDCQGSHRLVFVSSVMFDGNLGGLLGADAECQALAAAAGLPGTYMAWLSTAAQSPATRMTQSTGPYVRVDGVEVAPDWAGLVDGTLSAPIDVTETGGPAPIGNSGCGGGGLPSVWSATNPDGTAAAGPSCTGWTSTAGTSQWGLADATNSTWTWWCVGGVCNTLSPIYCVQQ